MGDEGWELAPCWPLLSEVTSHKVIQYLVEKKGTARHVADSFVTLVRSQRNEGHLFLDQQLKDILTLRSSNIEGTLFATTLLDLARREQLEG